MHFIDRIDKGQVLFDHFHQGALWLLKVGLGDSGKVLQNEIPSVRFIKHASSGGGKECASGFYPFSNFVGGFSGDMAITEIQHFVLIQSTIQSILLDQEIQGRFGMPDGGVESTFGSRERAFIVAPDIGGFTEPQSDLSRSGSSGLNDVFKPSQFPIAFQDLFVGRNVGDVILGVGHLDRTEFKQVHNLHTVAESRVENASPHIRAIAGPVSHAVVVDFLIRMVSGTCTEKVEIDVVDLGCRHGHLENVVFTPGLRHRFLAKGSDPFEDLTKVAMGSRVVRGIVGANSGVGQVLAKDVRTLLGFLNAIVMLILSGPVIKSWVGRLGFGGGGKCDSIPDLRAYRHIRRCDILCFEPTNEVFIDLLSTRLWEGDFVAEADGGNLVLAIRKFGQAVLFQLFGFDTPHVGIAIIAFAGAGSGVGGSDAVEGLEFLDLFLIRRAEFWLECVSEEQGFRRSAAMIGDLLQMFQQISEDRAAITNLARVASVAIIGQRQKFISTRECRNRSSRFCIRVLQCKLDVYFGCRLKFQVPLAVVHGVQQMPDFHPLGGLSSFNLHGDRLPSSFMNPVRGVLRAIFEIQLHGMFILILNPHVDVTLLSQQPVQRQILFAFNPAQDFIGIPGEHDQVDISFRRRSRLLPRHQTDRRQARFQGNEGLMPFPNHIL